MQKVGNMGEIPLGGHADICLSCQEGRHRLRHERLLCWLVGRTTWRPVL